MTSFYFNGQRDWICHPLITANAQSSSKKISAFSFWVFNIPESKGIESVHEVHPTREIIAITILSLWRASKGQMTAQLMAAGDVETVGDTGSSRLGPLSMESGSEAGAVTYAARERPELKPGCWSCGRDRGKRRKVGEEPMKERLRGLSSRRREEWRREERGRWVAAAIGAFVPPLLSLWIIWRETLD